MSAMRERRARAAGAMRKMGAALKGEAGIFQRLKEEHGEVASLMKQVANTDDGEKGVEIRQALFPKIRRALVAHGRAEERELYAVLRRFPETRDMVSHSAEEHAAVEQLLERLAEMDKEPSSWLDIFLQVKMRVEHHVAEEEKKLFPLAENLISKPEAEAIEQRYIAEKERHAIAV